MYLLDFSLGIKHTLSFKPEIHKQNLQLIKRYEKRLYQLENNGSKEVRQKVVRALMRDMTLRNTLKFRMDFRKNVCIGFDREFGDTISNLYQQAHKVSKHEKLVIVSPHSLLYQACIGLVIIIIFNFLYTDLFILSLITKLCLGLGIAISLISIICYSVGLHEKWSLDTQIIHCNLYGKFLICFMAGVVLLFHPLELLVILAVMAVGILLNKGV